MDKHEEMMDKILWQNRGDDVNQYVNYNVGCIDHHCIPIYVILTTVLVEVDDVFATGFIFSF